MAELESSNFELRIEPIELAKFLNETKSLMTTPALEKGLELHAQFTSNNLLVQTDRIRLQHVILSLLSNAIKFTDKGRILIGYKAIYFKHSLGVEIVIQDTGRGMSEEFQRHVFKEFAREEVQNQPDDERETSGTGLGLVIVKRIVEKLGGELSFESRQNEGSAFYIRLPLRTRPN